MRKKRNTQNTGSNPVPTTTIFCNNDKSDSPSAFFPVYKHLISGGISDGGCGGGD